MELKYEYDKNGNLSNIVLLGVNGFEAVSSVKEAVEMMAIKNTARSFTINYRLGGYANMSKEDIEKEAAVANILAELWRRLDEPDVMQTELNIAMLLVNSLVMNVRQAKEIEQLKKSQPKKAT